MIGLDLGAHDAISVSGRALPACRRLWPLSSAAATRSGSEGQAIPYGCSRRVQVGKSGRDQTSDRKSNLYQSVDGASSLHDALSRSVGPRKRSKAEFCRAGSNGKDDAHRAQYAICTAFYGISPRRYRDFFEKSLRKNKATGKSQEWLGPKNEPRPILDIKVPIYLPLEKYVEEALQKSKSRAIAALDAAKTVQGALNEEEEIQPIEKTTST
jgi:hypothetical protein